MTRTASEIKHRKGTRTGAAHRKNWEGRNLRELIGFLDALYPEGVSLSTLSAATGTTRQNVSQLFRSDDMRLSEAQRIVGAFGFRIVLYFPIWEQVTGIAPKQKNKERKNPYPNAGQLTGLCEYMLDMNRNISYLAREAGYSYGMIRRAFDTGDIKISSLRRLAEALHMPGFIWRFEPLEEDSKPQTERPDNEEGQQDIFEALEKCEQ